MPANPTAPTNRVPALAITRSYNPNPDRQLDALTLLLSFEDGERARADQRACEASQLSDQGLEDAHDILPSDLEPWQGVDDIDKAAQRARPPPARTCR